MVAANIALSAYAVAAYCGQPPIPQNLASRWNLDPILIAVLLTLAVAYAVWPNLKASRSAPPRWRKICFYSGWTVAALALISPLCALSVALFSARVGQHMVLAAIAAPLFALGSPMKLVRSAGAWVAAIAFAGVLWFWHAPGPYAATFTHTSVYWLMEISLFAGAYWLASEVSTRKAPRLADILAATAITALQMGVLGAVLTFAPLPLYGVHTLTTAAWGLSPLEDQQLGGVIMWVPAGLILVAALVACVAVAMRRSDHDALASLPTEAR